MGGRYERVQQEDIDHDDTEQTSAAAGGAARDGSHQHGALPLDHASTEAEGAQAGSQRHARTPFSVGARVASAAGGVAATAASLWRTLTGPESPRPTPAGAARAFAESLRLLPGMPRTADGAPAALPVFFEGACTEALATARARSIPLLIFLHSDLHEDADEFVCGVLADAAVSAYMSENFVVWGGSLQTSEGYAAAELFGAAGYPFVGVYVPLATSSSQGTARAARAWTLEGGIGALLALVSPSAPGAAVAAQGTMAGLGAAGSSTDVAAAAAKIFNAALRRVVSAVQPELDSVAAERVARDADRSLRTEQEASYAMAEADDRRRIEEARAAEAEAARQREAAEQERIRAETEAEGARDAADAAALAEAIALSHSLDAESSLAAARARLEKCPEPPAASGNAATKPLVIRFMLPSGAKLQRRFNGTDVVHLLRDYVLVSAAELGHEPQLREGGFELALTYPRRVLAPACDASELQSQQLGTQATFAVTVIRDASGAEATSAA